jgi:hypothetical protein
LPARGQKNDPDNQDQYEHAQQWCPLHLSLSFLIAFPLPRNSIALVAKDGSRAALAGSPYYTCSKTNYNNRISEALL